MRARQLAVAVALIALPLPALAQDESPEGQLIEAYVTCYMGKGDPETVSSNLGLYGWRHEESTEEGLVHLWPGVGESTFAYMALDGSFCHAESVALGTEGALALLISSLQGAAAPEPSYETDEMGCTRLALGHGITATITSGGNDPVCASDTDSAVRFAFDGTE